MKKHLLVLLALTITQTVAHADDWSDRLRQQEMVDELSRINQNLEENSRFQKKQAELKALEELSDFRSTTTSTATPVIMHYNESLLANASSLAEFNATLRAVYRSIRQLQSEHKITSEEADLLASHASKMAAKFADRYEERLAKQKASAP